MGNFAMVVGFILVLILAWRFLLPGVEFPGQRMIRSVLPGSSASPPRQHVDTPPYMFDVTNSNTVIRLP